VRGAVVNIGRGQAVSVRWLVDTLIAASGLPARVVEQAAPAAAARGAGIEWQQVDPSTARRLLGWRPAWALTDSVRALWEARAAAAGLGQASTGARRGPDPRSTAP
jgi:dTDP-6-deoxy-L-talose 4-dehydrogenase [NAD(P)+]